MSTADAGEVLGYNINEALTKWSGDPSSLHAGMVRNALAEYTTHMSAPPTLDHTARAQLQVLQSRVSGRVDALLGENQEYLPAEEQVDRAEALRRMKKHEDRATELSSLGRILEVVNSVLEPTTQNILRTEPHVDESATHKIAA